MSVEFTVRTEVPDDIDAIQRVNDLVFGAPGEGKLVDRLRADGLVISSVVAIANGEVIGHALFSELRIDSTGGEIRAAALAPVAVLPDWQGRGVGSALIREGLNHCRGASVDAVIVLGNPAFYTRFGFSAELAKGLDSPYSGPAWMALDFQTGCLASGGVVHYPDAFSLVD